MVQDPPDNGLLDLVAGHAAVDSEREVLLLDDEKQRHDCLIESEFPEAPRLLDDVVQTASETALGVGALGELETLHLDAHQPME